MSWWVWLIIILVLVVIALLIWWWLSGRARKKVEPAAAVKMPAPPPAAATPAPTPDDLKRIEGIGPKIAGLLQAAGITTFAQLAASDVSRLEQILSGAGLAMTDPSTWSEQASLAAAGKWGELQALQDRLKGGRRA